MVKKEDSMAYTIVRELGREQDNSQETKLRPVPVSFILYAPQGFSEIEPHLEDLRRAPFSFETIVVTTTSNRDDPDYLLGHANMPGNLKLLISGSSLEPCQIIKIGLKYCSTEYLCMVNGNSSLDDDFLLELKEAVESKKYQVIVSGSGVNEDSISLKLSNAVSHFLIPQTKPIENPFPRVITINRSISADQLTKPDRSILMKLFFTNNIETIKYIASSERDHTTRKEKFGLFDAVNYLLMLMKMAKYRPLKFLIVGLVGVGVNEGLLAFLHIYYPVLEVISPISIEVSILSNYILNAFWTFRERSARDGSLNSFSWFELAKYNAVALGGLAINLIVLLILTGFGIEYLEANFIGIMLGFIVNYIGSEKIVWKYKDESKIR